LIQRALASLGDKNDANKHDTIDRVKQLMAELVEADAPEEVLSAIAYLKNIEIKTNFAVDLDHRAKKMGKHIFKSSKA
jgi:hypothetical protein